MAYAGIYGVAFGCAAYCPAVATAVGLLPHLYPGLVIGGYVMTIHAVEEAEEDGVTAEDIEDALSGVAKGNPNPARAWDSVQRFYSSVCEVRVNKITGTIVTVIGKFKKP